jgi:hypothetical protein
VHRLDPALDVEVSDGIFQARALDGLAEESIDVGTIEDLIFHRYSGTETQALAPGRKCLS